jgi:hypothetical protein
MGFGSFSDSTSQATDNRIGVADNGRVVRGGSNVYGESGSLVVGKGGRYHEKGSIALDKKATLHAGTEVTGNKGTVVVNDLQPTVDLAAKFADTVQGLGASTQQTVKNALDQAGSLALTKETGGANVQLKFGTVIILAVLVLVGTIFYFRK